MYCTSISYKSPPHSRRSQLRSKQLYVYLRCIQNQSSLKPEFYPKSSMSVCLWLYFFPQKLPLAFHTSALTQASALPLFHLSLSLPLSFLLHMLQNNFLRLMFLVYFASETGTLVGVKWAKSQSISHIPNWLSLNYMIIPPPQKPFSEMIAQTGSLHLNWSLWSTRKKKNDR